MLIQDHSNEEQRHFFTEPNIVPDLNIFLQIWWSFQCNLFPFLLNYVISGLTFLTKSIEREGQDGHWGSVGHIPVEGKRRAEPHLHRLQLQKGLKGIYSFYRYRYFFLSISLTALNPKLQIVYRYLVPPL